jgi:hypothetical protein
MTIKKILIRSGHASTASTRAYATAARNGQHVVPSQDGWKVKKARSQKASGVYETQREAIESAMRIARNQKAELFIHARNGRIRERNSYGRDPFPPRE